jgi:protocatechuate 3,4-dioxygenase beta subunit
LFFYPSAKHWDILPLLHHNY